MLDNTINKLAEEVFSTDEMEERQPKIQLRFQSLVLERNPRGRALHLANSRIPRVTDAMMLAIPLLLRLSLTFYDDLSKNYY